MRFYRSAAMIALAVAASFISACAGPTYRAAYAALLGEPQGTEMRPVSPGKVFGNELLQIRAPSSPGWLVVRESSAEIVFGRPGASARETYVATVSFFELPPTEGREAFIAIVRAGREGDTPPEQFADLREEYEYTEARGYPCLEFVATSLDLKTPGGALPLAEHSLYCRHPRLEGKGFWVSYSQRALKADADLAEQAAAFLEGVVVPDERPAD